MPAWFPTTTAVRMFQNNKVGGREGGRGQSQISENLIEVLHTHYGGKGERIKHIISTFNKILDLISGIHSLSRPQVKNSYLKV